MHWRASGSTRFARYPGRNSPRHRRTTALPRPMPRWPRPCVQWPTLLRNTSSARSTKRPLDSEGRRAGCSAAESLCGCSVSYTHLRAHETSAHL
eukprot:1683313-Alexandrium_andersonii.AAC.1